MQDSTTEIAQMRCVKMKEVLTMGERAPASGRKRPESEDERNR